MIILIGAIAKWQLPPCTYEQACAGLNGHLCEKHLTWDQAVKSAQEWLGRGAWKVSLYDSSGNRWEVRFKQKPRLVYPSRQSEHRSVYRAAMDQFQNMEKIRALRARDRAPG